ncbi:MAG: SPOR domain-containing protein [Methylococcaceae bacterium]|nr:SPOR domain-containing protein [Methylococcaceae bacterium]
MTDFTNEKPSPRQHRLDSQKEDFDFELPEMSVTSEQVNPDSIPLEDMTANASATIIPPTQVVPEIKTNFYVDYFDNRKKIKPKNPEPVFAAEADSPSTVDNGSQDTMMSEKTPEMPTENPYSEPPLDSQAPVIDGAGMAVAVLSQFKSKQESINKQQEKLIQEFSHKIKTATTITYTAVFFGVVALAAATTLGIMLSKTKSEVSDLTGTTIALKDNIRNIKVAPDDLEGVDPAIDQLNEKVDELTEQLNEIATHQNKSASSDKTAITKKSANTKPLDESQTAVTVAEKNPASETTIKAISDKKPVSETPVKAISEKKPASETPVKATPASKAVKNTTVPQSTVVNVAPTAKPENTSKTVNKADLTVPKKINAIPDKALAVPANDINNVINSTNPPAVSHTNPPPTTTAQASSGWTVNLASSNKLEDAKKTAARFTQQGVPVTITPYTVKNETRYRLQVKGFKNKEEATAYGNKAKNTLKLNSVWINP